MNTSYCQIEKIFMKISHKVQNSMSIMMTPLLRIACWRSINAILKEDLEGQNNSSPTQTSGCLHNLTSVHGMHWAWNYIAAKLKKRDWENQNCENVKIVSVGFMGGSLSGRGHTAPPRSHPCPHLQHRERNGELWVPQGQAHWPQHPQAHCWLLAQL